MKPVALNLTQTEATHLMFMLGVALATLRSLPLDEPDRERLTVRTLILRDLLDDALNPPRKEKES